MNFKEFTINLKKTTHALSGVMQNTLHYVR